MEVTVLEGVTVFCCVFSGVAPDDQQPLEGSEGGNPEQNSPNATAAPQVVPLYIPKCPAFRLYWSSSLDCLLFRCSTQPCSHLLLRFLQCLMAPSLER